MSRTTRSYRIREFAALAGVTVRALHHYDRLGLLKPKRTAVGYRAYFARDLEALEQIVALKYIGIPLRHITILRGANPTALANALRAQRQTLDEKRLLLDRVIEAIVDVEGVLRAGTTVDATLFRRIIEVIEMQNNSDEWKKKYDSLVRAKIDRLKSIPPDLLADLKRQWAILIADIQHALSEDPAGEKAQELAGRWVHLLEQLMGGSIPASMMAAATAHQDAGKWTPSDPSFTDKRVWDFMSKALAARP